MPGKEVTRKKEPSRFWKIFIIASLVFLVIYFALSPKSNFNPKWQEPMRLKSENGLLQVNLDARKSKVKIGDKEVESLTYNEVYPGMTWEINQGDTVKVHLENNLSEPTNLHFHGSHVSPKGNSDNVLLSIKPSGKFDYEYDLAKNPPGLYWYHPHIHPLTENQVLGGMAGAIIVRGDVDKLPGIKGLPEKLLVLTTQDGSDPNTPQRLVNGMQNPTMFLRPGETVRMEVVNASADDHFNFAIPGYKLHIFSRDGNTMDQIQSVDNEVMSPGQRIQFIFTPSWYGEIPVKSLYQDQGFAKYVETTFMNIKVSGLPMIPKKLPRKLPSYEDLRNAKIDKVRTLTFSESGPKDAPNFLLDGKMVDMDRVDQIITLGTTEQWHLINKSFEGHPFHIHINPFQVISVNGKPIDLHGLRDTVGVPPYGEVVIRTRYKDFDGKFVLHCHILYHEDHGNDAGC
jgi:FtsP/CotA-like multicopper oxidase with cupredoxin domain